jgi:aryl-alcohol dehydrogenase-like predicted oxidoreductase
MGNSGLKTSVMSLGGWRNFGFRLNQNETNQIIHSAVNSGITTFDTADVYGPAEEAMGHAFKTLNRSDLVMTTKCYWPITDNINDQGLSRKHLKESVDKSLSRLQTDYIDLFLCHRFDDNTPLRETIRTFDDLIRQGKILYWGSSAWQPSQLAQALQICDQFGYERPIVEQTEYSLLHPEPQTNGMAQFAQEHKIGLMCWSPLAAGLLAGKNLNHIESGSLLGSVSPGLSGKYHTDINRKKALKLKALANDWRLTMPELALQWVLHQRSVSSVVVGVSSLTQLQQNVKAIGQTLSPEQIKTLTDLGQTAINEETA